MRKIENKNNIFRAIENSVVVKKGEDKVFSDLTNFSKERTIKEALAFYFYYLGFGILLSVFLGGLGYFVFYFENAWLSFIFPAQVISTIYSLAIYYTIYFRKDLNSLSFLLLGVFVGVINVLFTPVISLLISAFLTTCRPTYEDTDSDNISAPLTDEEVSDKIGVEDNSDNLQEETVNVDQNGSDSLGEEKQTRNESG